MIPACLALLAPVALCGVAALLASHEVPGSSRDMLNIALGALISMSTTVYSYYFGSSKGSRDKDSRMPQGATPTDRQEGA